MPTPPPRARPRDPITARRQNAVEEIDRSNQIVSAPGCTIVRTRAGTAILPPPEGPRRIWVKITTVGTGGGAGSYGFLRVVGATGGTWTDGTETGTFYESDLCPTLIVGKRLEIVREPSSGEWRVQLETCA